MEWQPQTQDPPQAEAPSDTVVDIPESPAASDFAVTSPLTAQPETPAKPEPVPQEIPQTEPDPGPAPEPMPQREPGPAAPPIEIPQPPAGPEIQPPAHAAAVAEAPVDQVQIATPLEFPPITTIDLPNAAPIDLGAFAPLDIPIAAPIEIPAVPEVPAGPPDFKPTSNRPIDRFTAMVLNDIVKMSGSTINTSRRGQALEIADVTITGVQRKTAKGTNTEIPRAALEWAIKQLYLNGELARSKMTESYKENGSSLASGVFAILSNVRYFEATDNPLTLHFYKLQWEDELYG